MLTLALPISSALRRVHISVGQFIWYLFKCAILLFILLFTPPRFAIAPSILYSITPSIIIVSALSV